MIKQIPKRIIQQIRGGSPPNGQLPDPVEQIINMDRDLPRVRIAIIGAGKFALQHLSVLSALYNVDIVGVSNRGGSDISYMKDQYGVEETFSDFRQMLDQTQPDAVFIVVSHFKTVEIAAECLQRGLACFIEKPAGFKSSETQHLADLEAQHHCTAMVGVNRRYIGAIHYALTTILRYGKLQGVFIEAPEAIRRFRGRTDLDQTLVDQWLVGNSIHAIDLFRCVAGEVEQLSGFVNSQEEPNGDSFVANMRLSSGALGTYVAHWLSAPGWQMVLYGDNVKAILSLNADGQIVHNSKKKYNIPIDPIDIVFKPGLFRQNQAFIRAIALDEPLRYPASDLADATKTMQLIEKIANGN